MKAKTKAELVIENESLKEKLALLEKHISDLIENRDMLAKHFIDVCTR